MGVSGPEFGLAIGELRRVAARTLTALASYDAVLTPTLASPPLPVGAIRDDADPAADFEAQKRFTPYTSMWNVTGSPADLAADALDAGRPPGRGHAGDAAGRRGDAARARRAGRGGRTTWRWRDASRLVSQSFEAGHSSSLRPRSMPPHLASSTPARSTEVSERAASTYLLEAN